MTSDTTGKPLAGEVTLYQKPTYTVVKFLLQNPRDNPVLVTMRQSLPESVDQTQVTFAEEYNGDAWEYEEGALTFRHQLDSEELIETAYGTRDISLETLQQRIRVSTITITDETGEQLGTVTGLQPTIAEVSDEAANAEQEDGESEHSETESEPDGSTQQTIPADDEETADQGDDESGSETAQETSSDATETGEVTADLPANRSDYILEDVRDKINSADEFDWQAVGNKEDQSGGVIGWVKSIFGR